MLECTLASVVSLGLCVAAQSRPASQPLAKPAVVQGRCVADEDGTPLRGCVVKLKGHGRNSAEVATAGEIRWQDPQPVTTDAEGRFEVTFVPPGAYQFSLDLQAPDRVPRTGRWFRFEAGQIEDLGEIRVTKGHRVRGKVVDADGKPVAKVLVAVTGLPLALPGTRGANDLRYGHSDAGGEFEIEVPLPAGRWRLEIEGRGTSLESPKEVEVPVSAEPLVLRVRQMPSVSGVIVDEDGKPAAGVGVQVTPSRGNRLESGRSDKHGRFQLFAWFPPDGKIQLTTYSPGGYEPFEPTEPVEWGTDTIRITVKRALSFELQVVDQATGEPVEEFAVKCHSVRAQSSLQTDPRLGGRHAGGKVTVDAVWRGANKLVVIPTDPTLASSEDLVVEAGEAPMPAVKVGLLRKAGLTVRVVNRDGQPVEGSTVELVDPIGHPFEPLSRAADPRRAHSTGRMPWPLIVGTATTDRLGRASLNLPPAPEGLLAVRVRGKSHATFVAKDIKPDKGQPMLELVAPRAARIQGKVAPADFARIPDLFVVVRIPGDRQRPDDVCMIPFAADGTFTFEQLPAQEVELVIECRFWVRRKGSGSGTLQVLKGLSQAVLLKEGETSAVVLQATDLAPGRIRARVLDGDRAASGGVTMTLASAAVNAPFGEIDLDADGWFEVPAALPGTYKASLRVSETKVVQLEGEFTLEPGKPGEWTFRVPAEK